MAILAALAVPGVNGVMTQAAMTDDLNNLRQIGHGLAAFERNFH